MDYSNLLGGLRVQTQIPLDVKTYSLSEAKLSNLGTSNNLAYTYEQGLIVYCIKEQTRWEWREVKAGEEESGLVSPDFVYPNGSSIFAIDYSEKVYNFFAYSVSGASGPKGDDGVKGDKGEKGEKGDIGPIGVTGQIGATGSDGTDGLSAYEVAVNDGFPGNETEWLLSLQGIAGSPGTQGMQGEDAANNLQKITPDPLDPLEVPSNYVLSDLDNNHTILINNGTVNIKIIIPNGLMENISVAFIQQGTGDVEFQYSGTGELRTPSGIKIKGKNYNAYLEQEGTTNNYHLIGNLKL